MTTDIMLTLALAEMSGNAPSSEQLTAIQCAISWCMTFENSRRIVNPAWIVAFRMAHSDHSTIRFDANYCTPQIWL